MRDLQQFTSEFILKNLSKVYSKTNYKLSELPPKTLCLTYDDGPGQYTHDIAKFLNEHHVRATFFVVGKYAYHHQDTLAKVKELGHIIGNHTYDHPDLPYYQSVDGELHYQVIRTDLLIRKFINGNKVFFRAPYGKWSAEVADELNANILSAINHIGPIHWDIDGIDCYYWKNDWALDDAVAKYLEDIHKKDHGIIVMHDEIADMDVVKPKNRTLELTKKLIPILLEQGYKFIGLDEIESLKQESAEVEKFRLRASNGKYIRLASADVTGLEVNGVKNDVLAEISLTDIGSGKVALKAANGMYFNSVNGESAGVLANSNEIGPFESFDLVQLRESQVIFRTATGNFLNIDKKNGNRLMCTVQFMRQAEIFSFAGTEMQVKPVSLKRRLFLLKKALLFIKSKLIPN